MSHRSIVIVGASAAGVAAALAMRDAGHDGDITLVDGDPRLPYERPPLSKSFAADGAVALRPIVPAEMYAARRIELRLGATVAALERPGVRWADGGALAADSVLLATGARARRLAVPGAGLDGVHTLRTADDAVAIAAGLRAARSLVVVGGGFIGLEVAAAARQRGLDVTVVEALPLPLIGPLGAELAGLLVRLHTDHGVRVMPGSTASAFSGVRAVRAVELTTGEHVPADLVVVGCGVVPNHSLAVSAGIASDGGILIDAYGRTSQPGVWAAGDVTSQPHPLLPERTRIEHWDTAQKHGTAVGRSMAGIPTEYRGVPYFWSEQYGLTLQMYGRSQASDTVELRSGAVPERFLAGWLRDGTLVAAAGIGYPRDLRQLRTLIGQRAAVSAEALRDPTTDFRRLVSASAVG